MLHVSMLCFTMFLAFTNPFTYYMNLFNFLFVKNFPNILTKKFSNHN